MPTYYVQNISTSSNFIGCKYYFKYCEQSIIMDEENRTLTTDWEHLFEKKDKRCRSTQDRRLFSSASPSEP